MPNAHERQQIFYLLKKLSSYTAWKRVFHFYQQWANMAEASVRDAVNQGWGKLTGLPESDYILILKGLSHCEEGVNRLRQGNKMVFKYDANGEFVMARRPLSHFSEFIHRVETHDNSIDLTHTPRWVTFCALTSALDSVWSECGPLILESKYQDEPASLLFSQYWRDRLATLPFPTALDAVPDPMHNTLVASGKSLPCSGIWEPVDALEPKKAASLFSRPAVAPAGPLPPAGCMNYLHGGANAPSIEIINGNDGDVVEVSTIWRLLWKDERYLDGVIPDEEAGYVFTEPLSEPARPTATTNTDDAIVWSMSGECAPVSGRWLVESDLSASIELQAGELLPTHDGRTVRWVLADD